MELETFDVELKYLVGSLSYHRNLITQLSIRTQECYTIELYQVIINDESFLSSWKDSQSQCLLLNLWRISISPSKFAFIKSNLPTDKGFSVNFYSENQSY